LPVVVFLVKFATGAVAAALLTILRHNTRNRIRGSHLTMSTALLIFVRVLTHRGYRSEDI
jgi:hypothetical protein